MKSKLVSIIAIFFILVITDISLSSTAQAVNNIYSNKNYGFSFVTPSGINLYTPDNPGPLSSQISSDSPLYLVNLNFTEENCNVGVTQPISESDIIDLKREIDQDHIINLPKYKRVSVKLIKIGKQKNKTAVEHIFFMQGNIFGELRQVTFASKGKGFTFTCATAVNRFDKANQQFFSPLFDSMTFE